MSAKIILFLSEVNRELTEKMYQCPDGGEVTGGQTNEAPVKYLLKICPEISEILCIVTASARETAWDRFTGSIRAISPSLRFTAIPFDTEAKFDTDVLPQVLSRTERGDRIFLETTGGLRDSIMYLLLISRALSYAGVGIAGAVYSNFSRSEITDVSRLIAMFDLIGGMQELTSFGSVRTLKAYYRDRPCDPVVRELLDAVDSLWESITLCRPAQITDRMNRFNAVLKEADSCSDPLMAALLPAFRKKFGRKLTTHNLIKWCVQSDMLQQALTLYKERIPTYILSERKDLLMLKSRAPKICTDNDYRSEDEVRFFEHLLKMGRNMDTSSYGSDADSPDGERQDYTVITLEYLEELLPRSYFIAQCPIEQLHRILMDYLYIRVLRNMTNHANDQAVNSQQLEDYLKEFGYQKLSEVTADDLRRIILDSLDHLKIQA